MAKISYSDIDVSAALCQFGWVLRHSISRRMPSSMGTSGFHPIIFSILARLKSRCFVTLDRTAELFDL
jgi:hypothetical protein